MALTSPLIELPEETVLGKMEWEADIPDPSLTDIEICTRTGDALTEETIYYWSGGETSQTYYERLPAQLKGPVLSQQVPAGGWSAWSLKYLHSGDLIASPRPRKFLQLQVKLRSHSPALALTLRAIRITFLPPVAPHRSGGSRWTPAMPRH